MAQSFRSWLVLGSAPAALALAFIACVGEDPDLVSPPTPDGSTSDASGTGNDVTTSPPLFDGSATGDAAPVNGAVVRCGADTLCRVPEETCCADADGSAACVAASACNEVSNIACDSRDDCSPLELCCGSVAADKYWSAACAPLNGDGKCAERAFCRTLADCPVGDTACTKDESYSPSGFSVCVAP